MMNSYLSSIIAHRGASALAPENTLAAFQKAYEIGAKWVEFDVMLAACGEAVVIHDETLDRTTNGQGNVCDYPYSYLQTLDAGSWFNPVFAGEKIPTLVKVITLLRHLNLTANIEIKPALGREQETVQKVLQVIEDHWPKNKKPPLISSFSSVVLHYVRKYSPTHLLAYLMDKWQMDWEKWCDELNCISVHVRHPILTPARIHEIKATNRLVLSYTVDDPVIAQRLLDEKVDALFSNCPQAMAALLSRNMI